MDIMGMDIGSLLNNPDMAKAALRNSGFSLIDESEVQTMREELERKPNDKLIVAQAGGQNNMLMSEADITIGGGSRGGPLVTDTMVVTPFGYRRIGDLKSGDIISGTDGGMQRVVYRKDHGKLPCYKLKFIDGSEVIASYDHLWNVRKTCYISKKRKLNGLDLTDDYRVWTTQAVVEYVEKIKNGEIKNSKLVIPVCEPIRFTNGHNRYGIDPYLLGVIIGDGCITDAFMKHNNVMLTTADFEVVDAFKKRYSDIHPRTLTNSIDYIFKDKEFVDALKNWKLAGHKAEEKFVPYAFKFGTIEERWAILQGLMDTDGTIDRRGHCSFTSVSEQLAKDVKFLVNSLGGLATIRRGETFYTKEGKKIRGKDAYHVYIRIKDSERLFRLQRKKDLCKPYNGGISEVARHIVDFEYMGEIECCCIAVNNTNSLFMVEDFVVTHNSKTYSLLMAALYNITDPNFRAIILRKELDDLSDIADTSAQLFQDFGTYNRSKNDMTWNFFSGGWLKFSYHNDDYQSFHDRFQGKQYAYIGIDEITQISYPKFKYLITTNRNAFRYRNHVFGTCNPDPDSWVARFIQWWIGEDGLPIRSRDGRIRYCFMPSDYVDDVVWGDSKQEVFDKCRDTILQHWKPQYEKYGTPEDLFVKSVCFTEARLEDNIMLMSSDPSYLANLVNQSEEQRARDLDGNWKFKSAGDDIIKLADMDRFYDNPHHTNDNERYVTCDVAFEGGDQCVFMLWLGNHIEDIYVCKRDAKTTIEIAQALLERWRVRQENFSYDLLGIGHIFKGYFPRAVPFNAKEAVDDKYRGMYYNINSQAAYMFADHIKDGTYSIEDSLLDKRFSGKNYKNMTLREILNQERRCIRFRDDDQSRLIDKSVGMKRIIGRSPDFIDTMKMREIFNIKRVHHKPRNLGLITGTVPKTSHRQNPFARRDNVYNGRRW